MFGFREAKAIVDNPERNKRQVGMPADQRLQGAGYFLATKGSSLPFLIYLIIFLLVCNDDLCSEAIPQGGPSGQGSQVLRFVSHSGAAGERGGRHVRHCPQQAQTLWYSQNYYIFNICFLSILVRHLFFADSSSFFADLAEQTMANLLLLYPEDFQVNAAMAGLYSAMGKQQEAMQYLQKAQMIDPQRLAQLMSQGGFQP